MPLLAFLSLGMIVAALVILFPLDWVRTVDISTHMDYSAFSPNGDGQRDTALLTYALSDEATVTIRVLDEGQHPVRTLLSAVSQSAGQHVVQWEGLNDVGLPVPDGKYYFQIVAATTARETVTSLPVYVDTTPPVIRLAYPPEDMTVGAQTKEVRIEGVTDPKASVWLNDMYQPVPVDENGGFRAKVPLKEGANRIEIIAIDEAGNRASVVRQITLVTQPPPLVIENPPDDLWINQPMLSVQGSVPAGVTVRVNGQPVEVSKQGTFESDVLLQEGENVIRIEAQDAVGNVTVEERRVFLRTQPPLLSLTNVQDQMRVSDPSFIILGKTEPGTTVWVNGRQVAVDQQGGFQTTVELLNGENVIRVEALDRAGNTATLVRRVIYTAAQTSSRSVFSLTSLLKGVNRLISYWPYLLTSLIVASLGGGLFFLWGQRSLSLTLQAEKPFLLRGTLTVPLVVHYTLSRAAIVEARVWTQKGQRIYTFPRRKRPQGEHFLVWNGRTLDGGYAPPGEYELEVSARAWGSSVSSSMRIWVHTTTQEVWTSAETSLPPLLETEEEHPSSLPEGLRLKATDPDQRDV